MIRKAIILAAGKGTRLNELTKGEVPKPLYPIGGKPLIEYSIESLISVGVDEVLIACGHMIESFRYLEEKFSEITIVVNHLYEQRSSIHTLLIFEGLIDEAFYLLEADILFDRTGLSKFKERSISLNSIMCAAPLDLDDNVYYNAEEQRLTVLDKKMKKDIAKGVMTGIWSLDSKFLKNFARYCEWRNIEFKEDYEVLLADYSRECEAIYECFIEDLNWCEIDNSKHLDYAIKEVLPKLSM